MHDLTPATLASATLAIETQPDTTTCGPTCLHAVYRHFGDQIALARGYRATIHTWNLEVFDRVIAAILLGTLTYDANLLVISPCDN